MERFPGTAALPAWNQLASRRGPGSQRSLLVPACTRLGSGGRETFLYVHARYRPDHPAAFVLTFHGAGGNASRGLYPLRDLADEAGLILRWPASRQQTWAVLRGGYGPDVAFIDQALTVTFSRCAVNPALKTQRRGRQTCGDSLV